MPRETKYFTDEQIKQIETMAGLGMPVEQMAAVFGISKATFERRQKDQDGVSEALLKGRSIASTQVRQTAFKMANSGKYPVMTIFWLKCREGWKDSSVDEGGEKRSPIGTAYVPKSKRKQ